MRAIPYRQPTCDFQDYYLRQVGHGSLPAYGGARFQIGSGLGNIFGGLWRAAVPLLKRGAKTAGKKALRTGIKVAGDVLKGRKLSTSIKKRGAEALDSFLAAPPVKQMRPSTTRGRRGKRGRRVQRGRGDIFS